ncbi:hypothetical protein [Spiroplasma endosymbiont of Polydrusus formosus]
MLIIMNKKLSAHLMLIVKIYESCKIKAFLILKNIILSRRKIHQIMIKD